MSAYATTEQLADYAQTLGVPTPGNSDALLDAASRDLDVVLVGVASLDTSTLDADQLAALARGCCAQAIYREVQGPSTVIGEDDGLAAAGGITFSLRTPARVSALAIEEVTGHRLLTRSGCAPPPLPTTVPTPYCP
jgi:hypothetical protein